MIEAFRELVRRVTELERRMANVIQTGTVSDVDYDKGRYRVEIRRDGNDKPVKTAWIPMAEQAGWSKEADIEGVSTWSPLIKGQQVHVLSRDGEVGENSWITPAGYRDKHPQISTDKKAHGRKVGKLTIIERSDGLTVSIGNAVLNVADGRIEIKVGGKRVLVTAVEILTDGKTRLNNGTRPTHYKGGIDSDGDVAKSGADGVLV